MPQQGKSLLLQIRIRFAIIQNYSAKPYGPLSQ